MVRSRPTCCFKDPKWVGAGKCEVGYYQMVPDANDAVRKWVAPHAGTVRIEGRVSLDHSGRRGERLDPAQRGRRLADRAR